MATPQQIRTALEAFLAGRTRFEQLASDLVASAATEDELRLELADYVSTGRLPADIASLLIAQAGRPTIRPGGDDAGMSALSPETSAVASIHLRVDDVVTASLVNDFKRFRDGPRRADRGRLESRQIDAALSDFHSIRLRQQASRAGERSGAGPLLAPETDGAQLALGDMLRERFVLDVLVGTGGMSRVYRAVDRRRLEALDPQPYVAVKVLSSDFRRHPDALRALEAEARKVQALAHPNICVVFDFDRDGSHAFLVMELLIGSTLDVVLRASPGGSLDRGRVASVVGGVLAGIGYAHARGIVHADLKPGNVFLCADGDTKVLDFGVATALRGAGFDPAGLEALTPGYASPEMARGEPRDPRDDVFALGCIVYLVLTGRHPYDRRPAEEAEQRRMVAAPIEWLAPGAWAALAAALSFQRDDRPADATEFADALLPALGGR
jgi:hypothetical protein